MRRLRCFLLQPNGKRGREQGPKIRKLKRQILPNLSMPGCKCHTAYVRQRKKTLVFAEYVLNGWGELGAKFKSEEFYKESVAKAILYRRMEKIVDQASGINLVRVIVRSVSYSIALLSFLIEKDAHGSGLDFQKIWKTNRSVLELDRIELLYPRSLHLLTMRLIAGLEWFKKKIVGRRSEKQIPNCRKRSSVN